MKKISSLIFVLLFINSAFLLPQLPDNYLLKGDASNLHVNSLVELITDFFVEQEEEIPVDRDNNLLENNAEETFCNRLFHRIDLFYPSFLIKKEKFAEYPQGRIPTRISDVIAPPPEHNRL